MQGGSLLLARCNADGCHLRLRWAGDVKLEGVFCPKAQKIRAISGNSSSSNAVGCVDRHNAPQARQHAGFWHFEKNKQLF
jgi:hypothetical protein